MMVKEIGVSDPGLAHLRRSHLAVAGVLLASTLAWLAAPARSAQGQQGRPRPYAPPIGVRLSTIIIFGDQYNGGDELYDAKITVTEVLRGEKAWHVVESASAQNRRPSAGMEYLLAHLRFEFAARVKPEHYDYALDPSQFSAMSAAAEPYGAANLAAAVKPELRAMLHSGDSAAGWLAFLVPRSDHTPLMMFRADVGSVFHEGDASFFKLYNESARR